MTTYKRRKRENWVVTVLGALLILFLVLGMVATCQKQSECREKGAVMMRDSWGRYECVVPVR